MDFLETYLDTIRSRGNRDLAESVETTSEKFRKDHLDDFSYYTHETGLLFGNVQSGKTAQMFGLICQAANRGFPVFLLLTTDNTLLQQQTLDRVKQDLQGFCVCGENDTRLFTDNSLVKPVIIVLKKNTRVLKNWRNTILSTGFMTGNPLFILDDEADAASLNTMVNQNKQSSINAHLSAIKNDSSSSLYLQVTGTPQALALQTMQSGWKPTFSVYFKPGKGYLGGNFFFPKGRKADCVTFRDQCKNPEKEAVLHHLAASSQILGSGGKVCCGLFHPGVNVSQHEKMKNQIQEILDWVRDNLDGEFKDEFKIAFEKLKPEKSEKITFDLAFETVKKLLENNQIKVHVLNGKNKVDSSEYSEGSNIVVGGNTLGRGVTFPSLHTIYYSRTSKKPQADTMWQHSRMFGYDRDPGLMEVIMDEYLYSLFSQINEGNESLIAQIQKGVQNLKLICSDRLNPTRKNVIDKKNVFALTGGVNYFPFDPENDSIEILDQMLSPFDENVSSYQVNLKLMIELLSHIQTEPGFALESFISAMETLRATEPILQGVLIVRRGRDLTKGTGAMLSPNDVKLGKTFEDRVVLTMYKVTGTKGWNNREIWIPNIKLPAKMVYYDVEQ